MSQSSQEDEVSGAYWRYWRKRMDALFPENPPIIFLDTSPTDSELQPVEPVQHGISPLHMPPYRFDPPYQFEPCSPPASPPSAALAEPSAPSREGWATAGGAESCCWEMTWLKRTIALPVVNSLYGDKFFGSWKLCPWCGAKLGEGEATQAGNHGLALEDPLADFAEDLRELAVLWRSRAARLEEGSAARRAVEGCAYDLETKL